MFNGSLPPMIVKVLDKDNNDYEFIGQAFVELNQEHIAKKTEDLWFCKTSSWYDIYFDKG